MVDPARRGTIAKGRKHTPDTSHSIEELGGVLWDFVRHRRRTRGLLGEKNRILMYARAIDALGALVALLQLAHEAIAPGFSLVAGRDESSIPEAGQHLMLASVPLL